MNPKFRDHLGELPTFLFPNGAVGQAKLVAGKRLLANDFANFVENYVNLLNSDDTLSPQSMSQVYNINIINYNIWNFDIYFFYYRPWLRFTTLM